MSDRISRTLAEYSVAPQLAFPPEALHEAKRRILDAIGVAFGAFGAAAPRAARRYAYTLPTDDHGSAIWGTTRRVHPEAATLANGVAVRYLDFNDTYLSLEPLHPSDMIPGLVALAEWAGLDGQRLLEAIVIAYEVGVSLCDAFSLRAHGWDHVSVTAIGTACGAARLLGLTTEQAEHALAITVVPHAAMRQTRAGELSMWKGFAAADAVRHAVYSTLLAAHGVSGPFAPFLGEMGFVRQLLGGEIPNPAAIDRLAQFPAPRRICDTYIKAWPVEYHAQSAVDAALALRAEIGDPKQIAHVEIETFRAGYEIIAKDPEKWRPKTRETADHSLPYITVVALFDGKIDAESFRPERFQDPAILDFLANHVQLREDPELTAGYPEGIPNRITVTTQDGRRFSREVRYPLGHAKNPMTDQQVEQKFRHMATPLLGEDGCTRVHDIIWQLENHSVRTLTESLVL
ncbi:MmgE/PrpD family protein [Thermorudis peleae]|uniref:MmgE/PrpD family protein n=1 Tax=Thermorudis peleae TaxID=1382356 RepID=UPI000570751C|nr:MmgE/PrpD family protein [Thermorudis peleae]MBX6754054.1 MmgE/PrpD family protein [Thermorudis peleae]